MAALHIFSLRELLGKKGLTITQLPDGDFSLRHRSGGRRRVSAFNAYMYGDDAVLNTGMALLRDWNTA